LKGNCLARSVLVSNGSFAVALDTQAQIRDIYYPYVGLENHAVGHPFRFGVWVNGKFEWLTSDWKIAMTYMPETLTSRYKIKNPAYTLELEVNDAVYHTKNVFIRKIKAANTSADPLKVRLFFTQDFHIYGYGAGDTAFYEPNHGAIVHYKGKRYFLVGGASAGSGFYQYAVGYKEVEGKEGTWRDCEDGKLSGNAVAQGAVDSAVSFQLELPPQGYGVAHYWVACGTSLGEVSALDAAVKGIGVEQMLLEVENYWSAWLSRLQLDLNLVPKDVARLTKRSLLLMRAHLDNAGGFLASLDSDILGIHQDTYAYIWPRDGAMASLAFSGLGFTDVSAKFFRFCHGVIGDDGYFRHKYLPDGSLGSTWHALIDASGNLQLPIQEDETASVLYALWRFYEKAGNIEFVTKIYDRLVIKAADFLIEHRDADTHLPKPTFDEWEEKVGVFTSTVAGVCAALDAAAKFARVFYDITRQERLTEAYVQTKTALVKHLYDPQLNRFIKGLLPNGEKDLTIDSSVTTVYAYEVLDARDFRVKNTIDALVENLWVKTSVGGLARYTGDGYRRVSPEVPGNPWFIATLRLARWHIAAASAQADLEPALRLLEWTTQHALLSGVLSEQLDPYSGEPISATPLLWSHAEYVLAVTEYIHRLEEFKMAPQPIGR
jgi:GH15 family glucan-1,4-alpha-glucosidase